MLTLALFNFTTITINANFKTNFNFTAINVNFSTI